MAYFWYENIFDTSFDLIFNDRRKNINDIGNEVTGENKKGGTSGKRLAVPPRTVSKVGVETYHANSH